MLTRLRFLVTALALLAGAWAATPMPAYAIDTPDRCDNRPPPPPPPPPVVAAVRG